jgi:hypothetical protein
MIQWPWYDFSDKVEQDDINGLKYNKLIQQVRGWKSNKNADLKKDKIEYREEDQQTRSNSSSRFWLDFSILAWLFELSHLLYLVSQDHDLNLVFNSSNLIGV